MVSSDILQNVFMLKYGTNTCSSFCISINNNDYLVTAKHMFENIPNRTEVEIEIIKDKEVLKLATTLLIHENTLIDIAVLDLKSNNLKMNYFDTKCCDYFLSQDSYFVGFPFCYEMNSMHACINNGFPIPFVKKGIISGFITSNKVTRIFLDGHNNPGFSGSPVVIENLISTSINKMHVIGVVSGYVNDKKTIKTPYGAITISENAGIVLCYGINHVFEIVQNS